jgi:hypothetical protein
MGQQDQEYDNVTQPNPSRHSHDSADDESVEVVQDAVLETGNNQLNNDPELAAEDEDEDEDDVVVDVLARATWVAKLLAEEDDEVAATASGEQALFLSLLTFRQPFGACPSARAMCTAFAWRLDDTGAPWPIRRAARSYISCEEGPAAATSESAGRKGRRRATVSMVRSGAVGFDL